MLTVSAHTLEANTLTYSYHGQPAPSVRDVTTIWLQIPAGFVAFGLLYTFITNSVAGVLGGLLGWPSCAHCAGRGSLPTWPRRGKTWHDVGRL